MEWLSRIAQWIREFVVDQPWLAAVEPFVRQTPDWALVATTPMVVATVLLVVFVIGPRAPRQRPTEQARRKTAAGARAAEPQHAALTLIPAAAPKPRGEVRTPIAPTTPALAALDAVFSTPPKEKMDVDNRTVRVFVSSTFLDMQRERDVLVRQTFPALRARFRARGVELLEVDLRWGITKEQSESGKTLPTLLAEIDRCRPYFIGLLGERYGWVPPATALTDELKAAYPSIADGTGCSVTELEIIHGVLRNAENAKRAIFFERDPAWLTTQSSDERAIYVADSDEARAKLADLKARIRASGARVTTYAKPDDIGPAVEAALVEQLEAQFPQVDAPDAFTQTSRMHAAYARERRGLHIGAAPYMSALDVWIAQADAKPMLITGASGGGKSTLVANWLARHRAAAPDDIVFEHYLGASPDSADPILLVRRLWEHLNRVTGESVRQPSDERALIDGLPQRLAQAHAFAERSGGSVVVILDGLDKLSSQPDLRWLPSHLPPRVRLLASSLDGEGCTAAQQRGWATLEVKPLTDIERREFIETCLKTWGRALSPARTERILASPLSGSPLFLKTLLDELRVVGIESELNARLDAHLTAHDIPDLFALVLRRLEGDCGAGFVRSATSLIWASRAGLEESEIISIAGATPLAWATLRNGLGDALRDQSGRVTFSHDFVNQAVNRCYLNTDEQKRAAHSAVADHFAKHADIRRVSEEWPWQLHRARRNKDFENAIFGIENAALFLQHGCKERLYEYWADVDRRGARAIDLFEVQWNAHHSDIEDALAAQNTAYLNPKYLVVPELCRLLLRRSERGRFAAQVADYFLEVLSFSEATDDEFRGNLLNALLLTRDAGNPGRALEVIDTLNKKFGLHWRGAGHIALSISGLESDLRAAFAQAGSIEPGEDEIAAQEDLLSRMRQELGADHRSTLIRANNLAGLYNSRGLYAEAERLHRDTFERRLRLLGPDAEDTLISLTNLGTSLLALGRIADAEVLLGHALRRKEATLGSHHYSTLISAFTYAQALVALGHIARATEMLRDIVRDAQRAGLTHEAFSRGAETLLHSLDRS